MRYLIIVLALMTLSTFGYAQSDIWSFAEDFGFTKENIKDFRTASSGTEMFRKYIKNITDEAKLKPSYVWMRRGHISVLRRPQILKEIAQKPGYEEGKPMILVDKKLTYENILEAAYSSHVDKNKDAVQETKGEAFLYRIVMNIGTSEVDIENFFILTYVFTDDEADSLLGTEISLLPKNWTIRTVVDNPRALLLLDEINDGFIFDLQNPFVAEVIVEK